MIFNSYVFLPGFLPVAWIGRSFFLETDRAMTAAFSAFVAAGLMMRLPQPLAFWLNPLILEFCLGMLIALARIEGIVLPRNVRIMLVAAAGLFYCRARISTGARLCGASRELCSLAPPRCRAASRWRSGWESFIGRLSSSGTPRTRCI
jgi:hypothetical protein